MLHGGVLERGGRLLTVDLEELVNGGLVEVGHVDAAALGQTTLITEFGRRGGLLLLLDLSWSGLLLRDQVGGWPVVATVDIHVESKVERAWLRHLLVELRSAGAPAHGLWSRGRLVEDWDEHG